MAFKPGQQACEKLQPHGKNSNEKKPDSKTARGSKTAKGFEESLWDSANKLRGSVASSE